MNLGENIFYHRARCRLSQGDVANALEISRQSVSRWENNSAVPELDKLIKLADLFGITLDELVFAREPNSKTNSNCLVQTGYSLKTTVGLIVFVFGLLGFLLSVFWGDHLRVGEEIGEILSINAVLLGIALLVTYNFRAWSLCAIVSFLYSAVSFGFLHITSLQNYLFVFLTNMLLMVWFLILGLHTNKENKPASNEK